LFGLKPFDVDPDNPGCLTWGEIRTYQQALLEHHLQMQAIEDQRRP
jgi:hypothetical protein